MKAAIQKIRRSLEATASHPPRSAKEYDDAKEALEALREIEAELERIYNSPAHQRARMAERQAEFDEQMRRLDEDLADFNKAIEAHHKSKGMKR